MSDHELDRLFDRFRRHGDVPALGAVFDATAPELLFVAMNLVRDPSEADDLLQETFLTAIERAARYDAERRLVPWLLGILAHHAKERRRLRGRELDPTRLEARGRELEAYLCHGKGAAGSSFPSLVRRRSSSCSRSELCIKTTDRLRRRGGAPTGARKPV